MTQTYTIKPLTWEFLRLMKTDGTHVNAHSSYPGNMASYHVDQYDNGTVIARMIVGEYEFVEDVESVEAGKALCVRWHEKHLRSFLAEMRAAPREAIAAVQHAIWAHWMIHLFGVSRLNLDGSVTIPADKVERWVRQMNTDYSDLPESERESDRRQADKVIDRLMIEAQR